MTTLADTIRALAENVQFAAEGTATGGSTTTLIDTARTEPNDQFTSGTIWFRSGNNVGKTAIITSWDLVTHTFTFTAQSLACAAGDLYSVASMDFPRYALIQTINKVLQNTWLPATDVTLVVVADQEEYSLPTGVSDVRKVEIAQNSAVPYEYQTHYYWMLLGDKLRFDNDYLPGTAGLKIRLTYVAPHAALSTDTGVVDSRIPLEWLSWHSAVYALRQRVRKTEGKEAYILALYNDAVNMARVQDIMRSPPTVQATPHLAGY